MRFSCFIPVPIIVPIAPISYHVCVVQIIFQSLSSRIDGCHGVATLEEAVVPRSNKAGVSRVIASLLVICV